MSWYKGHHGTRRVSKYAPCVAHTAHALSSRTLFRVRPRTPLLPMGQRIFYCVCFCVFFTKTRKSKTYTHTHTHTHTNPHAHIVNTPRADRVVCVCERGTPHRGAVCRAVRRCSTTRRASWCAASRPSCAARRASPTDRASSSVRTCAHLNSSEREGA